MKLPPLFDPDRRLFTLDKLEHFFFTGLVAFGLGFFFTPLIAFLLALLVGLTYEVGQWDTARGLNVCHRDGDLAQPFLPGYGIGLADLAADAAGAALVLVIVAAR